MEESMAGAEFWLTASEELRPAYSPWMSSEVFSPALLERQMVTALAGSLTETLWEIRNPNHSAKLLLDSWSLEIYEMINDNCFKLLDFGMVCYAAPGNQYKQLG